jgi:hypothetical protein
MISYTLNKETFNKSYNLQTTHLYRKIWSDEYVNVMDSLIKQFNTEYKWDGMFTLDDVIKRIDSGEHLFILFVSDTPIGYIWFKEITNSICSMYNLYISRLIKRPDFSSVWFVNKVCEEMIQHYDQIDTGCEDWHITMQNTFVLNGFTKLSDNNT